MRSGIGSRRPEAISSGDHHFEGYSFMAQSKTYSRHRIEPAGMSAAPTALVVPVLVTHPFRGGLTFGNGPTGLLCVPHFVSVLSEHNRKPAPFFITLGEPQAVKWQRKNQGLRKKRRFEEKAIPQRLLKPNSFQNSYGRPDARCGEVGRPLNRAVSFKRNEFFCSL
jgi:hypothetical protein